MAAAPPHSGDDMLEAVTEAMVALHERYHHRKPVTAKTRLLGDDLLICVLGGVYTDVEKTMIELQRSTIVQETRSAFQTAMERRFIDQVERLTGRDVAVCPLCGGRLVTLIIPACRDPPTLAA